MLNRVCVFLLALAGAAVCDDKPVITPCTGSPSQYSAPSDLLQVTSWEVKPPYPKAGDTITASFSGTITEEIPDGTIEVNVTLSGLVPIQQNFSLHEVVDLQKQLPLKPGPFSLSETVTLPDFLFGQVQGDIHLYATNGKQIACLNVDLDLGE